MRAFFILLIALSGFFSSSTYTQKAQITSAQISFEFVSKGVKGTIGGFISESEIDWDNLENSVFKGSVTSRTLDTNNGLRNWSLRSGKYFDVDDHPKITFESNQVDLDGERLVVKGDLTIKTTTKPVTFVFTKKQNQLIGTTSLYSIDYGIKIKKKREDNLVKIKIVLQAAP